MMLGVARRKFVSWMSRPASFPFPLPESVHIIRCRNYHAISTVSHPTWKDLGCNSNRSSSRSTLLQQDAYMLRHPSHLQTQSFVSAAAFLGPDFLPIKCAQQVLENVHDTTGLPWWASIVLSTFIMRTLVTFPLAVYAQYNAARANNVKVALRETAKELKAEVDVAARRYQWDEKAAKYQFHLNMRRLLREAYIRENCHPAKSIIVLLTQIPLWYSFSLGLRNLAGALQIPGQELPVLRPDLGNEGALWFSNLLLPDPYLILPAAMCISSLLLLEMSTWRPTSAAEPWLQKLFLNAMRVWSVMLLPIGAVVPSCMSLYWTCSILYGVGQNLFLRHPMVRQAFHIPQTKQDTDTPYADMWLFAKEKYARAAKRAGLGWQTITPGKPSAALKDGASGRMPKTNDSQQQAARKKEETLKNFSNENERKGQDDTPS